MASTSSKRTSSTPRSTTAGASYDGGRGPTSEETERGYFTVRMLGRGMAADDPFTVEAEFGADGGPGYGATARLLEEAGTCLLEDDIDSPFSGGVLTPASAIGTPLADRLRAVGFTATVSEAAGAGDE